MKLKTTVYTFKNKKPVFYEVQRFYKVKNESDLDKLINQLLDLNIDAVSSPCYENLNFPCILEMQSGFSLKLKEINYKKIEKECTELKKLLK